MALLFYKILYKIIITWNVYKTIKFQAILQSCLLCLIDICDVFFLWGSSHYSRKKSEISGKYHNSDKGEMTTKVKVSKLISLLMLTVEKFHNILDFSFDQLTNFSIFSCDQARNFAIFSHDQWTNFAIFHSDHLKNFTIFPSSDWWILQLFLATDQHVLHFIFAMHRRILRFLSHNWLTNFVIFFWRLNNEFSNFSPTIKSRISQYFPSTDWWILLFFLATYWWNSRGFFSCDWSTNFTIFHPTTNCRILHFSHNQFMNFMIFQATD